MHLCDTCTKICKEYGCLEMIWCDGHTTEPVAPKVKPLSEQFIDRLEQARSEMKLLLPEDTHIDIRNHSALVVAVTDILKEIDRRNES